MKTLAFVLCIFCILSCDKCPPPPPDNFIKIKYHHNFQLDGIDVDRLGKNIVLLNNLSSKLDLPYEFKKSINKFDRSKQDYINELESGDSIIHVFLDPDEKMFDLANHDRVTRTIEIPRNEWLNPTLLLHEIYHFITKESGHAKLGSVGRCSLEKNNGCMNLMSGTYITPFNFLLTEIQHQKFLQVDVSAGCGSGHVYPKDLIQLKIENEVSCCPTLNLEEHRHDIIRLINEKWVRGAHTYSLDEIIDAANIFLDNKLCPINLSKKDTLIKIQNEIQEYTAPDGTQASIIIQDSIIHIENNLLIELSLASNYVYVNKLKEIYYREAEYITRGTGIDKNYYYNNRIIQVESYLEQNYNDLTEIREIDPLF